MELSLKYYTKISGEDGHISIQTPLIPIKYQIRTFPAKRKRIRTPSWDRTIIYLQNVALNEWSARIHMESEEMLAFTRKCLTFLRKNNPEGLKLLLQNMGVEDFLSREED